MTEFMTLNDANKQLYRVRESATGLPERAGITFLTMIDAATVVRRGVMRLQRIAERECNGVQGPDGYAKWDDADQDKADKARERAESRIVAAFDTVFDMSRPEAPRLEFQGDPRGAALRVYVDGREVAAFW